MRRANGNGSVVKLKGRRRRPFCARVTVWVDTGTERRQKRQVIGCFKTRPEAEDALYKYTQGYIEPPESSIPTFGACFDKALEIASRSSSAGTVKAYKTAVSRISELFPIRVDRVTPLILQDLFDRLAPSFSRPSLRLSLAAACRAFDYALRMSFISSNPASVVDLSLARREPKRERRIFSPSEIEALTACKTVLARQILVLIYTGMRRGEALALRVADVDTVERVIYIRKSKTAAGVRAIPIADPVIDIVLDLCRHSRSGYVFENDGRPYSYTCFGDAFAKLMSQLGMDHIPHETRHTFATLLYNAKVDEVATKAIIGHSDIATTRDVYTHESLANLREAISRLS